MALIKPDSYDNLSARLKAQADRRTVIRAGAGAALAASALTGTGPAVAQDEMTSTAVATPDVCILTPELMEGPFWLDHELIRTDITQARAGVPLDLKIQVLDPNSCLAIEHAAVDIWHCDALGYYSGIAVNQPGQGDPVPEDLASIPTDTFLRGVQLTDADGAVQFKTIYPGWYPGRAIHIHMKVFVGGAIEDATDTYEGGHTAHTGQLFFDEESNDLVFSEKPYSTRVTPRLANRDDSILGDHADEPGFMLHLELNDPDDVWKGLTASITVGVDPITA